MNAIPSVKHILQNGKLLHRVTGPTAENDNQIIFRNKRICGIYPLNQVITGNSIPPGPLAGPKGIVVTEYWDGDSFANLTDPNICCYWNHDRSLMLGSIGRGSLRLWLTHDALHFELIQEVGNEIAAFVFQRRMVEEPFVGLSPGYRPEPSGKRPVDGAEHVRVHLREFSLTPRPAHKGSRAWLQSDLDKKALDKYMADSRRWLDETSKAHDDNQAARIGDHRAYLEEQKKLKSALKETSTESWNRETIDAFKKAHPHFQRFRGLGYPEGYERSSFSI